MHKKVQGSKYFCLALLHTIWGQIIQQINREVAGHTKGQWITSNSGTRDQTGLYFTTTDLWSQGHAAGCGFGECWAWRLSLCLSRCLHWSAVSLKTVAASWWLRHTSPTWQMVGHVLWCWVSPRQYPWKEQEENVYCELKPNFLR